MSDFKIPGMPGGMGGLMEAAQKFQTEMARIQNELGGKKVEASAGGGMVTVVANGRMEIVEVRIDQQVVDPKDVSMLQDLVLAAVNQALRKAKELMETEMARVTGGMSIPGLPGMPF